MQATRIIKTIEQTQLYELTPYLGKKVEIIILPLAIEIEEEKAADKKRIVSLFEMIDECAGHIAPWTREELYDRQIFS